MKMYVGVTDYDWYTLLKSKQCDEVNFWTPGTSNFKAIEPNDMLLFKLHAPNNYIVGGGFFVRFSILPTYLAWSAFGIKNGVLSLDELNARIAKYRSRNKMPISNPQIGCIILTEPFFFDEADWIPAPENWKPCIVKGKTYNIRDDIGLDLYNKVQERLQGGIRVVAEDCKNNEYAFYATKHRLGQGAFRVVVADILL